MYLSDDFFAQWDHIISSIDNKTNVPIDCISKLILKLSNKRQKTINVVKLKRQGMNASQIEEVLSQHLLEFQDQVRDVEFILDLAAVANIVQPHTDKLLKNL